MREQAFLRNVIGECVPELFDKDTCSCRCDASVYHRDRVECEARSPEDRMLWDETTCSCVHEGSDRARQRETSTAATDP